MIAWALALVFSFSAHAAEPGAKSRARADTRDLCVDSTDQALDAAEAMKEAFVSARSEVFIDLYRLMDEGVSCLERPLSVEQVQTLLIAYGLFTSISAAEASTACWSSLKRLGGWDISSLGLPEDAHVVQLFRSAPLIGATTSLKPAPGGWEINGERTDRAPRSSFVAQGRYADGRLWWAGVVSSTVEVPEPPVDLRQVRLRNQRIRAGGNIAGGSLLGIAAVTLSVAAVNVGRVNRGQVDPVDVPDVARTTNSLTVASGVLFGVGVTTGGLAWGITWGKTR